MSDSVKLINESENAKLFRSRMDIFVLNALNEKDGQGYGYDVISYIQNHTKGHYKIKSVSTIYNILKRLEAAGYVSSEKGGGESNGAARVYYTLTDAGKEYLERDKKEWKYIRTLLNNLVSDEDFDLDNEEPPYSASVLKPLTKRSRESSSDDSSIDAGSDLQSEQSPTGFTADKEIVTSPKDSSSVHFQDYSEDDATFSQETAASSQETAASSQEEQSPMIENTVNKTAFPEAAASVSAGSICADNVESVVDERKEDALSFTVQPVKRGESDFQSTDINDIDRDEYDRLRERLFESTAVEEEKPLLSPYMESLKKNLQAEGYVLNTFVPSQKSNTIRYFFVNKIMRDTLLISFLYLIVTLLVTNLFKNIFGISLTVMHVLAGIGFFVAFFGVIHFARNPRKKKKDATNLKLLNSVLLMIFVVLYMAVVVYYLFSSKYNLTSTQMYAPAIILSTLPFSGLIFSVLYKSDRYFQT